MKAKTKKAAAEAKKTPSIEAENVQQAREETVARAEKSRGIGQFRRITPTLRGGPPHMLLNCHQIERVASTDDGSMLFLRGANSLEPLPVAEPPDVIEDAMRAKAASGFVSFTECLEGRPVHRSTFSLASIRSAQPEPFGSLLRFGDGGSGRFDAYEDLKTIEHMIAATARLSEWSKGEPRINEKLAKLMFAVLVCELDRDQKADINAVYRKALDLHKEILAGKSVGPELTRFL
jgi:hypothetical protein